MHTASEEWAARVAARNEIEMAKALAARHGLMAVPLSAGARPWVLSPADELAATVKRQKEGGAW